MHVMEDYTRLGSKPESIEESLQKLRELIPTKAELQYIPETNRVWGVLFCAQIGREIALRNIISIQPDYVGN